MKLESFKGIIAATITPNNINTSDLDNYLSFLREKGVRGVFVLGTMGEGAKLSSERRKEVAEAYMRRASQDLLRIVHVGTTDQETAINLARHAEEISADATSAIVPYYYRYDAESLANFFSALGASSKLPLLVYNNPGRQGYQLSVSDIGKIFELVPAVRGIKDTSGDIDMITELQSSFGSSHLVACGGDHLLHYAFTIGVRAHVSSLASIYPELAVGIFRAVEMRDHREALRIQLAVNRVRRLLRAVGPDTASYRFALLLRGFDLGPPLPPTRSLREEEKELLTRGLQPINRLAEEVGKHG
ncbi:MAG: dihydrodipicolinate synthase family protein [Nitrososphaerota archaeon]